MFDVKSIKNILRTSDVFTARLSVDGKEVIATYKDGDLLIRYRYSYDPVMLSWSPKDWLTSLKNQITL